MNHRRLVISIILVLLTVSGIEYTFIRKLAATQARTKSAVVDLVHTNIKNAIEEIDYIENAMANGYDKDAALRIIFLDSTLYNLDDHIAIYDAFLEQPSSYELGGVDIQTQFKYEIGGHINTMRRMIGDFPTRSDSESYVPLTHTQVEKLITIRKDIQIMQQRFPKELLLAADAETLAETLDSIRWNIKEW